MIMAGPAGFVSSNYHAVFAAKNGTKTTSSSSKGGGGSTNNSTSPIGSSTFLKVITKVDNTKGGTAKPSDFTITVSGKSPTPTSFSGSSSGTSVTLKAGKYKVTGSGLTGYTTKYSSGCSGTAGGGVPIKCTVSPSFSKITSVNSTSTTTKSKADFITLTIKGWVKRSDCMYVPVACPEPSNTQVTVEWYYQNPGDSTKYVDRYGTQTFNPKDGGAPNIASHSTGKGYGDYGYIITTKCQTNCNDAHTGWVYEESFMSGGTGTCAGGAKNSCYSATTGTSINPTVNINFYWKCTAGITSFYHC
jgi:hypothetical protein